MYLALPSRQFTLATALLYALLLVLPMAYQAEAQEQSTDCFASYCLESGDLDLAVALGYGVRTNPLNFSDHRSLVIVPDIAWYGENWYLDNLEVGYQWTYNSSFAFETFVTLNNTNRDFQDEHGSSFLFDGVDILGSVENGFTTGSVPGDPAMGDMGGDSGGGDSGGESGMNPGAPAPGDTPPGDTDRPDENGPRLEEDADVLPQNLRVSPEDVGDRDFAVDVGIRAHWYTETSEWTLALFHDISDVYGGARASVGYRKLWLLNDWKLVSSASLEWRSADLLDYYYGIDSSDVDDPLYHYDAGAGLFASVGLTANREITENWQWLLHLSYNQLPSAMTDSPLVEEDYIITTFAGVTYRF